MLTPAMLEAGTLGRIVEAVIARYYDTGLGQGPSRRAEWRWRRTRASSARRLTTRTSPLREEGEAADAEMKLDIDVLKTDARAMTEEIRDLKMRPRRRPRTSTERSKR